MELHYKARSSERKCEANRLRKDGKIPAVIYNRNEPGETISIERDAFTSILRTIKQGRLPTTVFTLMGESSKRRAILKDIQYNPVNYEVIHLDFEELVEDRPINVKVPVEFTGIADSAGLKLGGVLRQVIRHVRINCLPKDIPDHFQVDVRDMVMADVKRIKDLDIPKTVRPLVNMNEVIVVIAKR